MNGNLIFVGVVLAIAGVGFIASARKKRDQVIGSVIILIGLITAIVSYI